MSPQAVAGGSADQDSAIAVATTGISALPQKRATWTIEFVGATSGAGDVLLMSPRDRGT